MPLFQSIKDCLRTQTCDWLTQIRNKFIKVNKTEQLFADMTAFVSEQKNLYSKSAAETGCACLCVHNGLTTGTQFTYPRLQGSWQTCDYSSVISLLASLWLKTRVVIMMRRSWDCCLLLFQRHNSPGDKTMRQEQEGIEKEGGWHVLTVSMLSQKTKQLCNCHARRLDIGHRCRNYATESIKKKVTFSKLFSI